MWKSTFRRGPAGGCGRSAAAVWELENQIETSTAGAKVIPTLPAAAAVLSRHATSVAAERAALVLGARALLALLPRPASTRDTARAPRRRLRFLRAPGTGGARGRAGDPVPWTRTRPSAPAVLAPAGDFSSFRCRLKASPAAPDSARGS